MDITNIEIDTLRITYLYSLYFLFEQKDLSVDLLLGLALSSSGMILHPLGNAEYGLIPRGLVLIVLAEGLVDSPGQPRSQDSLQVRLGLLALLEVGEESSLLDGVPVLVHDARQHVEERHDLKAVV